MSHVDATFAEAPAGKIGLLRGPWAIAVYTFREGIRKKTLIGFLILSVLVIFGSNVITAFLTEMPGSSELGSDVEAKLIKDICITTISIFGVLITIFVSASVVPSEVENKVIYTVLSKPLRRWQYLFGKFLGIQLIVILNLGLMGFLFFMAIYFKQNVLPTLLLWALLLTYLEFLVVSSLTFAVSCTSSSSVLPTISGLFIYLVGHLTEYLRDVHDKSAFQESTIDKVIGNIAWVLYNALPNLQRFSMRQDIIYLSPDDPPKNALIGQLLIYGLVWAVIGYVISFLIFRKKEL